MFSWTLTFIYLNLDNIHYYPFMVSLDRYGGIYSTLDDEFDRIYVLKETEDVNIKISNMITGCTESELFVKHVSYDCRCRLDGKKCYPKQKSNTDKCWCEYKK